MVKQQSKAPQKRAVRRRGGSVADVSTPAHLAPFSVSRFSPGWCPQKPTTTTVLYTALKAFNNVCELISEYDDAVCISVALFSDFSNISALYPCLCAAQRHCAHSNVSLSSRIESGPLHKDNISAMLSSAMLSTDMTLFIFSPHFLRSQRTWDLIVKHEFGSVVRVLLGLDVRRVMNTFDNTYRGWPRRVFRSKKMQPFVAALDELAREPPMLKSVAQLIDDVCDFSFGGPMSKEQGTALFNLFTRHLQVNATLGNPCNYEPTALLLGLFDKYTKEKLAEREEKNVAPNWQRRQRALKFCFEF